MQVPLFHVSCGTKSLDWKWSGGRRFQSFFPQSWIASGSAVSLTQSGTGNQTCGPTRRSRGGPAQSEPTHRHAECQSCYKYTQLPPITVFSRHTLTNTIPTCGHSGAPTSFSPSPERTCNYTLTRDGLEPAAAAQSGTVSFSTRCVVLMMSWRFVLTCKAAQYGSPKPKPAPSLWRSVVSSFHHKQPVRLKSGLFLIHKLNWSEFPEDKFFSFFPVDETISTYR